MVKYIFRMYAARPGQRSPPVVLDLHTRESPSRFLILPKDDSKYFCSIPYMVSCHIKVFRDTIRLLQWILLPTVIHMSHWSQKGFVYIRFNFSFPRLGGLSWAVGVLLLLIPRHLPHHEASALLPAVLCHHPRHLLRLCWCHLPYPVQGHGHRRSGSWRTQHLEKNFEEHSNIRAYSIQLLNYVIPGLIVTMFQVSTQSTATSPILSSCHQLQPPPPNFSPHHQNPSNQSQSIDRSTFLSPLNLDFNQTAHQELINHHQNNLISPLLLSTAGSPTSHHSSICRSK